MTILQVLEAVVERGIEPLASAAAGGRDVSGGRAFAKAYQRKNTPPPAAPKPAPAGKKELIAALEKSELESVVFGMNLGSASLSNRDILSNNFSIDLDKKIRETCAKKDKDTLEPIRLVEDALSCVDNMEFLGGRSAEHSDKRKNAPAPTGPPFCSMPIKFSFGDRQSRVSFEKTLSEFSGIRASQSYPKPIRDEMTLFRTALLDRYQGMIIMTRPAPAPALELVAFKKFDGDRKWIEVPETHPLPMNIMLSSYTHPNHIVLPALSDPDSDSLLGAVGGGGGSGSGKDAGDETNMNCD
jgi:hypothetical protein